MDSRESADPHPWVVHFSKDVTLEHGTLETGDFALAALPDATVRSPLRMCNEPRLTRRFELTTENRSESRNLLMITESFKQQLSFLNPYETLRARSYYP